MAMRVLTIHVSIDFEHGQNLYEDVIQAIKLLQDAVKDATPENPALGGSLRDARGRQIGSYLVSFFGEPVTPRRD